jgi:NADH-quinone oxidoreductase subunit A
MNLDQYLPVLLFILVGVGVGVAPQVLGRLISKGIGVHKPDAAKNSPYECGFEAFEDARMKFDVRYYLVAILFILFDLEIAFLFPWAVALKEIGIVGFWAMMIFLASWWSASSTNGRRARWTGNDPVRADLRLHWKVPDGKPRHS